MKSIIKNKWLLIGLIFTVISVLVFLPFTKQFRENPEIFSVAILLDLLVTIPLLYLMLIWKRQIPKFTVAYVIIGCILLANFIIPEAHKKLLTQIQIIAIPLIEVGIFGLVIYKLRSLRQRFKEIQEEDFYNKLVIACEQVFPKRVARILATELGVFYYLFNFSGTTVHKENQYTYYKKSGIKMVIGVFLCLLVVETFIVHILVSKWHEGFAWVLTFLGCYAMLQILAIIQSMDKRPISIDNNKKILKLNYGFACQSQIPFAWIKSIGPHKSELRNNKNHTFLSVFDLLDTNNVTIELNKENILYKIYGIEKKYDSISLFVDDKERFVHDVKESLGKTEFSNM